MRTKSVLHEWCFGPTEAERLGFALLDIEGYEDIDPQSPLGGRDGIKDFICRKRGKKYVVATYFPPTRKTFPAIRRKFLGDLKGVAANGAKGFVFVINQPLTPGERKTLREAAAPIKTEIYHLERLRGILDTPRGYPLRRQYLGIPINGEDWAGTLTLWLSGTASARRLNRHLFADPDAIASLVHAVLESKITICSQGAIECDVPGFGHWNIKTPSSRRPIAWGAARFV